MKEYGKVLYTFAGRTADKGKQHVPDLLRCQDRMRATLGLPEQENGEKFPRRTVSP